MPSSPLEMHCSKRQQKVIAQLTKDALGKRLYPAPTMQDDYDLGTSTLPSPEELKYKVLLKTKTLWAREVLQILGWHTGAERSSVPR